MLRRSVADMSHDTGRTPHPEEPAEGAPGVGTPDTADQPDELEEADETIGGSTGGAIQGDSSRGGSTGGAIQGDAGPHHDAPLGGDRTTHEQLDADNEVENDTLKTLNPEDPA